MSPSIDLRETMLGIEPGSVRIEVGRAIVRLSYGPCAPTARQAADADIAGRRRRRRGDEGHCEGAVEYIGGWWSANLKRELARGALDESGEGETIGDGESENDEGSTNIRGKFV